MLKYIKKYWYFAIWAPIFMIGEVCMDLLQPSFLTKIIDEGVNGLNNNGMPDLNIILTNGLIMIGLVILGGIFGVLSGVFANLCSQNFANDLRCDCFRRVMHLSFEQTDYFETGSLVTRITNDVTQIQNLVGLLIRGFVRTFMLFGGGIFCMLMLDLSFGIVLACALPLVIIFVIIFIRKASPKFKILQKKIDTLNSVLQENVSGARVVKAYVKEEYEENRFEEANSSLVGTQRYVLKLFSLMQPITNIILNLSIVAIIYVGGINVKTNQGMTTGQIMAAITYISRILMAVLNMANLFQTASRAQASSIRIKEILRTLPVISDGAFQEETSSFGKIEFQNVSFSYPDQVDVPVLQNLSFTIESGQTIGILGSTGSGKSSLVQLIPRFYDVSAGNILIDDVDIKEYSLEYLRSKISIALQKSELFSKTIYENIAFSKPSATKEEIIDAAKIACADDFISSKESGYYTVVAEKGMSLSGGQKQRISIARAILKPSEILIFDDTTSALDLKTEAKVFQNLNEKHKQKTKIIIAQRISTVMNADIIFVLEHGKIVDRGNHKELLENSKIYQEIYNSQLKGGVVNE
ncbi:MAG: ABC transporter ATP-binding protein/permease [Anaeroplasmataceae bacterium]|nr:ABC transporter ATP-binding protein/permease [Anaeroplasmataceae bacterium]